jgi:aromatic ring hydroxylase
VNRCAATTPPCLSMAGGWLSVADERAFQPGITAIALTYDYALKPEYARLMTAVQHTSGKAGQPAVAHRHEQR